LISFGREACSGLLMMPDSKMLLLSFGTEYESNLPTEAMSLFALQRSKKVSKPGGMKFW
jgi:hypothetical protein